MDPFEAFFSGNFQRKTILGGSTQGRVATEYETTSYKADKVPERTLMYAQPFIEAMREHVRKRFETESKASAYRPETTEIYNKFNFLNRLRAPVLPIEAHRQEILDKIWSNPVVVLRGPTGCGKTTKVPQFILDDYRRQGLFCNIVVAQPRRIAASTNAKRVCQERGWKCGELVGYQVGSDHRAHRSDDTRILFCTTGVLVESILNSNKFNPLDLYTHIILDEVHERDKDMDFLMIAIYKHISPRIRIIMMSATIDTAKFARYYKLPLEEAPIIELGAQSNFHVTKIFLDDIEPMEFEENIKMPEITEQMYRCALRLIVFFERIDRMHSKENGIDEETYERQTKPTVLIFLPGIFEIKQMYQRLEEWVLLNDETKLLRIVMHSTADPLLSDLAMQETNRNTRKIILATNIAESSITVPDVKYVIDFCLSRTLVMNPATNFPSLQLTWASRDNCEQRSGRTGRVMDGWCFRLVSRNFYSKLRQSAEAELVTSPLENIILKTKQLDLGSPEQVLALALDKPYLDEIHNAVLRLKEMGAMLTTVTHRTVSPNGAMTVTHKTKARDGDITYIGHIMSRLPIEVKLSKLIALGYCFGVLDECIIIACALNCSKNMFLMNKEIAAYTKHLEFADGSGSDLFAVLNAYKTWARLRNQGEFGNVKKFEDRAAVKRAEKDWAAANFLEIASLRECDEYVKDLRVRVKRMNLIDINKTTESWSRNEKYIVLKVVIAGAFYPNHFSRSTRSKRGLEVETVKTLGGRDLGDTVYFSGFKGEDFPHIYIKSIRDILIKLNVISQKEAHTVIVSHDGVAEKVYVSFRKHGKEGDIKEYGIACHPGFVLTEVYKAVKLRSIKGVHHIEVLSDRSTAKRYANDRGLIYKDEKRDGLLFTKDDSEYENVCYPRKLDESVKGFISHTENCGRFWFQPNDCMTAIKDIFEELNNPNSDLERFQNISEVLVGQILAAVFPNTGGPDEFYRAKVLYIAKDTKSKETTFEVRFIDFGNTQMCSFDELRRLRGVSTRYLTLPPYCFLCSLAFIQPSQVNAPDGVWKIENNQVFVAMTDGFELEAKVYSVLNGVARVFLYKKEMCDDRVKEICINKILIDKSIAEHCEESYMSKFEHIEREIARNEKHPKNYLTQGIIRHLQEEDVPVINPPTRSNGQMHTVELKGPFSPLEIGLFGLANNSSGIAKIDPYSVNSVLLENEPNDMSEKYLVAVSTHQSDENSAITVRHTTLMPNIRLFGPFMAAIFAPQMRLKRNPRKTHYITMITGLGLDDKGVCLSDQSNLKFDLDAELKNSDLELINSIRSSMDKLLSFKCFKKYPKRKVEKIMGDIQSDLISLLSHKRLLIADEYDAITWEPYKREDLDEPEQQRDDHRSIFRRHQILRLCNPELEYLIHMKDHHDELLQKRFSKNDDPTTRSVKCQICKVDIDNGIRHHLYSRQHKDGIQAVLEAIDNFSR